MSSCAQDICRLMRERDVKTNANVWSEQSRLKTCLREQNGAHVSPWELRSYDE